MRRRFIFVFMVLSVVELNAPKTVPAQAVPKHLACMAVDLLKGTERDLASGSGDEERVKVLQRTYRILKQEGLFRWGRNPLAYKGTVATMAATLGIEPVTSADTARLQRFIDARSGGGLDAAMDELCASYGRKRLTGQEREKAVTALNKLWTGIWGGLPKTYALQGIRGPHRIVLSWDLESARFRIRVEADGDEALGPSWTEIEGQVRFKVSGTGQDLEIYVVPATDPIRDISQKGLLEQRNVALGNESASSQEGRGLLGERKETEKEGEKPRQESIKADFSENEDGPGKEAPIGPAKEKEPRKVYVWKNPETGEVIRQTRFSRLKAPFEYEGEFLKERPEDQESEKKGTAVERPSSGMTKGMTLTCDKEIYYVGDEVRIRYTIPDGEEAFYKGVRYDITLESVDIFITRKDLSPSGESVAALASMGGVWDLATVPSGNYKKTPLKSVMPALDGRIALDVKVTMRRKVPSDGSMGSPTEIFRHFRLRQPKVRPVPGALSLQGGAKFFLGDTITTRVNIPASSIEWYNFAVQLYYLNRKTKQGAVQQDFMVFEKWLDEETYGIVESSKEIEVAGPDNRLLYPGIYELRLIQTGGPFGGIYVVDTLRFESVFQLLPGRIRMISPEKPRVGENIVVGIQEDSIPFQYFHMDPMSSYFDLGLYKVVEDTKDLKYIYKFTDEAKLALVERKNSVVPGEDVTFNSIQEAGRYVIQMIYAPGFVGNQNAFFPIHQDFILDIKDFEVIGRPELKPPYLGTGEKKRFLPDEKVPVNCYVRDVYGNDSELHVFLYRMDASHIYGVGEPLAKWRVKPEEKAAWTIPKKLPMGSYVLILEANWKDNRYKPRIHASTYFQVVPEFGKTKVHIWGQSPFLSGKKIDFNVVLTKGLDINNLELSYYVKRKEGSVPGCAKLDKEIVLNPMRIDNPEQVSFHAPLPGEYVIDVTGTFKDQPGPIRVPLILARTLFSTDVSWEPHALAFSSGKSVFEYGQPIKVEINAPEILKFERENKYLLKLFRQGDVSYGGAYRHVDNMALINMSEDHWIKSKDTVVINEKSKWTYRETNGSSLIKEKRNFLPVGSYELRLYHGESNDYGGLIISRLAFNVIDSTSPFIFEQGNTSVSRPTDIKSLNLHQGLKIGEMLGPNQCDVSLLNPPVEPMTIRFVKWDHKEKKYVPIPGGLDFGQFFYVEGKLEQEASLNFYIARITNPQGVEEEVVLVPDEEDPTVIRSELLYFIWESQEVVE